MPYEPQDTEVTLGTGKLLGIFFAMVIVCAGFFSFGYMIGHGSREATPLITDSATLAPPVQNPGPKPAAGKTAPPPDAACAPEDANCTPAVSTAATNAAAPSSSNELSFFANVDKKDASDSRLTPPETKSVPSASEAGTTINRPAPELSTGYMVQVAAVSKQEDAEALVNALRHKQYPVLLVPNPANSKLFHVQVGPFAQLSEAEAMRVRLSNDGYNAILKR